MAVSSVQITKPEGTANQKVYKQLVKNNFTVRFISYVDSYFIRMKSGSYYFEDNGITYVDKKSKKINLNFPRSKLRRLFIHGDYVLLLMLRIKNTSVVSRKIFLYQYSVNVY